MRIEVFTEGNISLPFEELGEKTIKRLLKRICKKLLLKKASITLIAADNDYIRKINREYRNKDAPTDVISFSYREAPFPQMEKIEHLGDIYLSLEKALENAGEYRVDFIDEIKRLLVHGVLHLTGYDHVKPDEAGEMNRKQEDILRGL